MVYPTACCVTNWLVHMLSFCMCVHACLCVCVCVCACICMWESTHTFVYFFWIFNWLTLLHYVLQAGVLSSCHVRTEWRLPYTPERFASVHCAFVIAFMCICGCLMCFFVCFGVGVGGAFGPFCIKQNVTFLLMWGKNPYRRPPWGDTTPLLKPLFFFFSFWSHFHRVSMEMNFWTSTTPL